MANFRYSLNSSTIQPTPILKKIEVAAAAGYEGIELWHADIDKHLDAGGTVEEIRAAVDASGLEVPTTVMLKGWCEPDGAEYEAGIAECKRKLGHSQIVGAKYAIAGPPHGPVDFELAARRYKELMEIGEEFGVKPVMEYLGIAQDVNTIADAIRIMDGSGRDDATIVLDPFHDFRGGGGHADIAKLTASQIAIVHFDDAPADPPYNQQRDPDRVMPGDGIIDLPQVVALLKQVGYNGFVSLELFRPGLWKQDPLQVAKTGLAAMKRICEA